MKRKRLDTIQTCKILMSCLANRRELLGRNRKRVNASHVPGVEDSSLADVGFYLSSLTSTTALMELFGHPWTPPACRDSLMRAFRSRTRFHDGLQLLQTHGSRNIMMSLDETVTFPTYSMMRDERGS